MPRLVSLTLLSMLIMPAGALLYVLTIVVGYEMYGWGAEIAVWLTADVLTFALVMAWWLLLWRRSVKWTAARVWGTAGITAASVVVGLLCGLVALLMDNGETFGLFVGGTACMIAWLVGACILWRDRTTTPPSASGANDIATAATIVCPQCGYALNGLREARCPECGQIYTLDALLFAQPAMQSLGDLDRGGGAEPL